MGNTWRKIFIRPEVEGKTPEALDSLLTEFASSAIVQDAPRGDGSRPYSLDDKGRYEIRFLVDGPARALVNGLVAHEGFQIVQEVLLEGSSVLGTINYEGPGFPGRRK